MLGLNGALVLLIHLQNDPAGRSSATSCRLPAAGTAQLSGLTSKHLHGREGGETPWSTKLVTGKASTFRAGISRLTSICFVSLGKSPA